MSAAMKEDKVDLRECERLDEFWEYILPTGPIFGTQQYGFIYRGHRDADWALCPQAYRKKVIEKYKIAMGFYDHQCQIFFESTLLSSYIHYCDQRGLAVLGDSMAFRDSLRLDKRMLRYELDNTSWPPDDVLPLMALAQHHGIPTRLLDWTHNAMVACYFAAAGAVNKADKKDKDKKIAVFGLSVTAEMYGKDSPYRYVYVPGSTSQNIPAQSGCFVLVNNFGCQREQFTPGTKLEDMLQPTAQLVKLTLPMQLAGELLKRCIKYKVSAGSIYPSYDGAAKAVLESNLAASFLGRFQ